MFAYGLNKSGYKNFIHKFSFCIQHDSVQCGIARLCMVCKYHGREYTMETLSEICFVTHEGVTTWY